MAVTQAPDVRQSPAGAGVAGTEREGAAALGGAVLAAARASLSPPLHVSANGVIGELLGGAWGQGRDAGGLL